MSNPMYVYISPIDLEWRPGRVIIEKDYPDSTFHIGRFAHYMADVMAEELVKAIDRQRFSYKWKPLSVSYFELKKKKNLSLNIWEATGTLKDNITVYRSDNVWVVGIHRYKMYPGTNVRIYQVVKYMEYGTDRMPARPLFRPLALYLRKNIRVYWERYREEVGIS